MFQPMRATLPPYLVVFPGSPKMKRCSVRGTQFAADAKPSLSKAFAAHVREIHNNKPTSAT
jgi:hypothetical protein